MKFRSIFSACKTHCCTLSIFPVRIVSNEGHQESHHCLHFLPAGSLQVFSVVWVFHRGLLPQVQSHTNMVTQVLNDGEPVHGHLGAQAESLYPPTTCWVSIVASQTSPSPNSVLISAGASGPSHKANISACKICWDHRWRWTGCIRHLFFIAIKLFWNHLSLLLEH